MTMDDTDHPAGNGKTPSWWPPADTPPATNVVVMPDRPPVPPPPAPPAPPTVPPVPEPPAPPSTDVVPSDSVPGRLPTDRIKTARVSVQRHRRWIALAAVVIIALAGLNWWASSLAKSVAGTMIGYDPNTQYATLDPGRAATVETQVRAFVVQNPLASLRLTATDATTLTVMVGGTKGVPLVDCSGATSGPARQDPSKTGGDTATTAAATR
jgi:hypothetical protein